MIRLTLLLGMIGLLGSCAVQNATSYQNAGYKAEIYSGEEILRDLKDNPFTLHQGKPFARSGVIDCVVIEGNPSATNGKRSITFTIQQYSEYGEDCKVSVTGPACCVKQVDDHNINFRVSGSLQFFRLHFDPQTGAATLRTLSGESPVLTFRYVVRKLW